MNIKPQPFADVVAEARKVVVESIFEGGVTVKRNTYPENSGPKVVKDGGFVVGGAGIKGIKLPLFDKNGSRDYLFEQDLIDHAARFIQALPVGQNYVGGWVDGSDLYIDAVDFYTSRKEALAVARLRGELAIYDLDAGEEVRVQEASLDEVKSYPEDGWELCQGYC